MRTTILSLSLLPLLAALTSASPLHPRQLSTCTAGSFWTGLLSEYLSSYDISVEATNGTVLFEATSPPVDLGESVVTYDVTPADDGLAYDVAFTGYWDAGALQWTNCSAVHLGVTTWATADQVTSSLDGNGIRKYAGCDVTFACAL